MQGCNHGAAERCQFMCTYSEALLTGLPAGTILSRPQVVHAYTVLQPDEHTVPLSACLCNGSAAIIKLNKLNRCDCIA